ncbi:MAG: Gfo/Idh/MocA family oxidoreductase [Granulosicoccus sp.]|nr:Gfo/Idh/MocA family oxidoreductase [Granulosicoccus sp.]
MSLTTASHLLAGTRRLRLGMVGGGLVSHWHHAGIRLSNRWDLIAGAFSSDPTRAVELGRQWLLDESRIYTDYEEMARQEGRREDGIEAVAICTPNHTHCAIAEVFLRAGIDVICDKPLANSRVDGEALQRLQQETGLILALTHPYIYHPMVRQAQTMIAEGAIGVLRQFVVEYAQEWAGIAAQTDSDQSEWRKDPAKAGRTSTTGDIGTHAFQLLEYVTGQTVEKLRADFHVCGPARDLEDTAFFNLTLEQGAPGTMWLSQVAAGQYCGLRFRLFGDGGSLSWDQEFPEQLIYARFNEPQQILLRGQGAGMLPAAEHMTRLPRGHGESLSDAWSNLYSDIAACIGHRRTGSGDVPPCAQHLPDVQVGVRGIRFIDAAADSHEAGGVWVSV